MKQAVLDTAPVASTQLQNRLLFFLAPFIAGLIGPLGFSPFQYPGMTLISIAVLYWHTNRHSAKKQFLLGFFYGLGYFGFGVSWVILSIHDYGHLNYVLALVATLGFVFYLSLYPALMCSLFYLFSVPDKKLLNGLFFSSLWCLSDFLRSTFLTGFPWLLVGTSQMDTPLRSLVPIVGIYGIGLLCVFSCTLLAEATKGPRLHRYCYLIAFVLTLIVPSSLNTIHWTRIEKKPMEVAVIQGNLAMRDKWDESLFWSLLKFYEQHITALLNKRLIILPESAIPLPASYLSEYLEKLNRKTTEANSALVLGILQPTDESETSFYNAILSLGHAKGSYIKQHLVPFGEYIPRPFFAITQWLGIPPPMIAPGRGGKALIQVAKHPVASLICYDIAYPQLLRQQMPLAQWIISISDNGWFGHSLASYQLRQMAQVLSLMTGRFQILANNDGLSSIINEQGHITSSLPPFTSGTLEGVVYSATGTTPWTRWGDWPAALFCSVIFFLVFFSRINPAQYH